MRESTRNNISTVFWATGSLERRAEVFEIPVSTLRNTGYSRTFKLTVTDTRHFVSKVEPTEFTLGPDQLETVRVALTVPAGTSQAIGDDVIVVATSTAGPATSNSSVAHFSVTVPATNPSR